MTKRSGPTRRAAILSAGAVVAVSATAASETAAADDARVILFERAPVTDYNVWFKAFGDFAPDLKAAGVLMSTVYRSVDNPNDITVAHEFKTVEEAQAFLDSDALKKARAGAGVTELPTTWFTHKVYSETF